MAGRQSYSRQLRCIGQALEAQRIRIFDLKPQGERFTVNGEPDQETSLLAKLRAWQKRNRAEGLQASLNFTTQDLDQLDRQGRSLRAKANQLPDFHLLPNTLRTVGAYLDAKGAELIELRNKELSIAILWRNPTGHPQIEERSLGSLYELFVRQHAQRDNGAGG